MVKITVKEGKDPKLKRPTFICDAILKHNAPPPIDLLVNGFKVILIVGRAGSGKTSFTWSLFKDKRCLKRVWNNIILVMPKESLASMTESSNIFKNIAPEKFYNNINSIDEIEQQIRSYAEDGESTCLILDDQMAYLKNKKVEQILCSMMANRRHLKCSIIILSQLLERVPLKCRKQINDVILMYKPSRKELVMAFEEYLEQKEDVADSIQKMAFTKPYDFLFIDVPSQKLFSNYNEIIISNE